MFFTRFFGLLPFESFEASGGKWTFKPDSDLLTKPQLPSASNSNNSNSLKKLRINDEIDKNNDLLIDANDDSPYFLIVLLLARVLLVRAMSFVLLLMVSIHGPHLIHVMIPCSNKTINDPLQR